MSAGAALEKPWSWMYAAVVLAVFVPLYLLTRSDVLISDGPSRVLAARSGDHADIQYFYPLYVLGVPLINLVWVSLTRLGLTVSVESVLLGLSLCGTLAAIVFVGLIAAQIVGTRSAAWLVAIVVFGYPLLALLFGRTWTTAEVFGVAPDPTAIATVAALGVLRGFPRWVLTIVPLAWCAIAAATLWAMNEIAQALVVVAAAALAIAATGRRNGEPRVPLQATR